MPEHADEQVEIARERAIEREAWEEYERARRTGRWVHWPDLLADVASDRRRRIHV